MEKRSINPWTWQDERSYVQAVEVKQVNSTLYCSGQAAIDADGRSSDAPMGQQLQEALANLEQLIAKAGSTGSGIVRLNVYTTSTEELWPHFNILQTWLAQHQVEQALTVLEVKGWFETLKVELEARVVK